MNQLKHLKRALFVPAFVMLGACCSQKDVVVAPVPPPPAPAPAPVPAPAPAPAVVPLGDVYFDLDRHAFDAKTVAQMNKNIEWLNANPGRKLIIEGHCDERGSAAYNKALGERRANAVKEYLVGHGADPARLETVSYGSQKPLDPGHNKAAWAKNRRVHFVGQ